MEPADRPLPVIDDELAEALPAALERASLLEWRLEQVTLREKDLWLRLEAERTAAAAAQQRVADLSARLHEVEDSLAETRRDNAALTARLAEAEGRPADVPERSVGRDAVALARAWQREHQRASHYATALKDARDRLDVLEHAQVRFHARLTQWHKQVAADRHELDLAEFIAEMRAEILRLGQANAELRTQLSSASPTAALASASGPPPARRPSEAGPDSDAPCPPPEAIEALWSSDTQVRRAAATRAGRDPATLSALRAALAHAIDGEEKALLLRQLAKGGALSLGDVEPFLSDEAPMVRAAAIEHSDSEAILAKGAADPDPYVRRRALLRWSQTSPSHALAALTRAIHDSDPGVRRAACAALAGVPAGAGVHALLTAADDSDECVRAAAIRGLPPALRHRLGGAILTDDRRRRAALVAIRAERRAVASTTRSPYAG